MGYLESYRAWRASPAVDAETKRELAAIAGDPAEIEDRFYRTLEFGTAGLRGVIGAGTNRMNVYVVRQATQGLADYLGAIPGAAQRGVCIAYDSRRCSELFARETAAVLAGNGVRAYLFERLHAVPQLSFAVRHLGCAAGVVITASHNPAKYNGYKVYWSHGGQCTPEQAADILRRIQLVPMFAARLCELDEAVADGRVTMVGKEEDEAYYAASLSVLPYPDLLREKGGSLPIVYTPLHGTGNLPVRELLRRAGVTNVSVVPEQAEPDGAFPTVHAPNPEDPDAFRLAIQLAERTGAHVCLATDPDADRLGVAVKKHDGRWAVLTGNQIGCLLLEHLLGALSEQGRLPKNGVVIKSIVSTRLADAIAARYGVEMVDVLTGFRFISEKIDEYARTGEKTFLFGFEESYGFLAGGYSRDKDAILAAALAVEMCAAYDARGMTLYDGLQELYRTYGYYKERVNSYTLEGKAGMERIAETMATLRRVPITAVEDVSVTAYEDYLSGTRFLARGGGTEPLTLPRSDLVRLLLSDGSWIVVRPSGTEPKLKLYIGGRGETEAAVDAHLAALFADMDARLRTLLGSHSSAFALSLLFSLFFSFSGKRKEAKEKVNIPMLQRKPCRTCLSLICPFVTFATYFSFRKEK